MSVTESDKALRYIGLLEDARINASWANIPELVRKVDKHAPHRKCLTVTATSEAVIASAVKDRPSTPTAISSHPGLLDVAQKLIQALDQDKSHPEDAFQAKVCLQEVDFLKAEWNTTIQNHQQVSQEVAQYIKDSAAISPNTRVAILKSCYFLGIALEQQGDLSSASQAYQSGIKAVMDAPDHVASASEYRIWSERVLGRASLLVTDQDHPSTLSQTNTALLEFRNWSNFWHRIPGKLTSVSVAIAGTVHAQFDLPRKDIWGRYYKLLSFILATGLVYSSSPSAPLAFPSDSAVPEQTAAARLQQRAELKRVETAYESLLLQETRFPGASQTNEVMENWVQQAMANWQIFCGPRWRDEHLGEGGKEAVSRNMLDILYRAATKSFHSTPILRSLFNVHASLAEFDLAMRAFDTYSDIITRGKARADKTGEHETGLDTDDLVMVTAAQAINILCKYGSRAQAEKAVAISKTLTSWLVQNRPPAANPAQKHTRTSSTLERTSTESLLSRSALAAAYRAIGHAQANWGRMTYEPLQRKDLRTKALAALRRASDLATPPGSDPDTALLLATVLAESRDLIPAIQVLKKALALSSQAEDAESESVSGPTEALTREQRAAPLWHLLSLLLTARGEFENAVRVGEAAFEQLDGPLLSDPQASYDKSRPYTANPQSLIDQMEDSVKDSLIQVKVTQLALMEVLESPAVAADASSSLLALYHKLFGSLDAIPKSQQPNTQLSLPAPPPRTGTLRSIGGSILGRKTGRKSLDRTTNERPTNIVEPEQPAESPVSIQVTNEDGHLAEKHHHHHIPHHPFKLRGHQGDWREAGNLRPASREPAANGFSEKSETTSPPVQALGQIPHNSDQQQQPPLNHGNQPIQQDLRLPAPHPASSRSIPPRFPTAQTRRHRISLLIDVWLFTAGQYVRSELFEDAEGAINEAHKLVESFQMDVAKTETSARAFDERGWGGGKSVNRLWADVHAERGVLAVARDRPFDALASYEQALSYFPDHPVAVVGISDILLDIYEEKVAPESASATLPKPDTKPTQSRPKTTSSSTSSAAISAIPPPAQLNRLAARDRAYMLLNTLSKLGEGWDDSETWTALARAHELSGQIDRAKECLWWVVELEDARPIRPWNVVSIAL